MNALTRLSRVAVYGALALTCVLAPMSWAQNTEPGSGSERASVPTRNKDFGNMTRDSVEEPRQMAVAGSYCGSDHLRTVLGYPTGMGACKSGTQTAVDSSASDGQYNWTCTFTGTISQCLAYTGGGGGGGGGTVATNGGCGPANNTPSLEMPETGLCNTGTANITDSQGSDNSFNWQCQGSGGGTSVNCSAPKLAQSNGVCGSAANTPTLEYPTQNHCQVGTVNQQDTNGTDGAFNWTCSGVNGGQTVNCDAVRGSPSNGVCGSAHGVDASTYPQTGRCASGTSTTVDSSGADGTYNWTCSGSLGGPPADCSARAGTRVDGVCGSADGQLTLNYPVAGLCSTGTAQTVDNAGTDGFYDWRCMGGFGGSNQGCSARRDTQQINGACGPQVNSCTVGTGAVIDNIGSDGFRDWTCNGSNGGQNAACSVPVTTAVNGQCGFAHNLNLGRSQFAGGYAMYPRNTLPPTHELCLQGVFSGVQSVGNENYYGFENGNGGYGFSGGSTGQGGPFSTYRCLGVNGGSTSEQCFFLTMSSATPTAGYAPPACGSAATATHTVPPSTNLCATGSFASAVMEWYGGTHYTWICTNTNTRANPRPCRALKGSVPGICGTAHQSSGFLFPQDNHCARGTPAWVDRNGTDGQFNWTCSSTTGAATACFSTKNLQVVNGRCGPSANTGIPTLPAHLCEAGLAAVSDPHGSDGAFNWNCNGFNGGSNASCIATASQSYGQCGFAHNLNLGRNQFAGGYAMYPRNTLPPTHELCLQGVFSGV